MFCSNVLALKYPDILQAFFACGNGSNGAHKEAK